MSAKISAAEVRELRAKTGCGMMDCKEALMETSGDLVRAIDILRKKGLANLAKRSEKQANEGLVQSYIHANGKIGVLLEVNCETDFVARNDEFKKFVHDMAMQIAAAAPVYVSRDEIGEDLVQAEMDIYREQAKAEGKPDKIADKIVEGRMEKFYASVCLIDQAFIKDPDIIISDYLGELGAKLGENISIRRFSRYQLGEEL